MFMKFLSFLILLTLGVNALGADTVFVTDKLKLGRSASGVDKVMEFDIGAGANNPKMRYSVSGSALQFSNDGTSFDEFGSGGAGSGGFGGLDSLNLLIGLEKSRIYTPSLPYTLRESFSRPGLPVTMWLMENYTSPSTSMTAVVNPKFFDTANKVFDGVVGWAVGDSSDAANIATSATRKIGSNSLSWDKSAGTDTVSLVAKDYTGVASFVNAKRIYYFLNMPSVTQFASAGIRVSDEATVDTNYREIVSANNCAGTPVTTGWNLMCFDTSVGVGTNVGTGWAPTDGIRTLGFEVNTSAAGQTYTAILVDSVVAVDDDDTLLVQAGDELTIYDGSNAESMKIDSSSSVRGTITLDAALANNYSAGLATFIKRSVPAWTGNGWAPMVEGLTGAINLTQQIRLKEILDAAVAGKKFDISINESTPLAWYVSSVDSSVQIKVTASDYSAEMVIGDKYHVFSTHYVNGKKKYIYRNLVVTLDQVSSYASGVLTFHNSGTNAGVAVGDLVVKDSIEAAVSCVSTSADESFASIATHKTLKVEDTGIPYPAPANVVGHWKLGGGSDALTNQKGTLPALTEVGAVGKTFAFLNNLFGAGPYTTTGDYFSLPAVTSNVLCGDAAVGHPTFTVSFWYYPVATEPSGAYLVTNSTTNPVGNSWTINTTNANTIILIGTGGATLATSPVFANATWHHIMASFTDGVASQLVVDGVVTAGTVPAQTCGGGNQFTIGNTIGASTQAANSIVADLIAWDGYYGTAEEAKALYNGGKHVPVGEKPLVIHGYESAALTGQKLTVKGSVRRRTSAVNPVIHGISAAQQ